MTRQALYVVSSPSYFAGVNRIGGHISHITGVIDAFVDEGYKVSLVTDMRIPEYVNPSLSYVMLPFSGVRKKLDGMSGGKRLSRWLFLLLTAVRTFQCLLRNTYHFLYVRHNGMAYIPIWAARVNSVASVLEVNTPVSMGNGVMRSTERYQYKNTTVITVVSPIIEDWLLHSLGEDIKSKIIVNPNGVDLSKFNSDIHSSIREELDVPADSILLGMAANYVWYNAIGELLKSFQKAHSELPELKLMLMGDSKDKKVFLDARKQVESMGLGGAVYFVGAVPFSRIPEYLSACDILLSYFNYGDQIPPNCSIKHLEYMAMGKPVIATDVGYVNFAVDHQKSGLLVGQGDDAGLVSAILELARDKDKRIKYGRYARNDVVDKHGWNMNAKRILKQIKATKE